MHRSRVLSFGPGSGHRVRGDPREAWPGESDFHRWLMANPGVVGDCLGVSGLRFTHREAVIGSQAVIFDVLGRLRPAGGLRLDLAARDDQDRVIVIETQFGGGDHAHFGQLVTYASAVRADLAVWMVAGTDPLFHHEHLAALHGLNQAFAGSRLFTAVTVTLESGPLPAPPAGDEPLNPRLRRVRLADGSYIN